jgi:alkylated DNA repair dioxygenase AlkB
MDLFNSNPNILHYDGEAIYYGHILSSASTSRYFDILLNTIAWQHDEAIIYGKHYVTKRKVAWYGNERYNYTYSNTTKQAQPWTPELAELKLLVENITGTTFNSCLLNLYHNGEEGMAWHSDDEKALGHNTIIASLSLGAARKFSFKHKQTHEKTDIILEQGSLLVMQGATQTNWLHRLPPSKKIKNPRINLTFRTIIV